MNPILMAAAMFLGQEAGPAGGVAIERTVRRTTLDWLGRREEVQRKELLLVKGSNLAILDQTFGGRLIIRTGLRKLWKVDPLARVYAELTFDEMEALRKAALADVRSAKGRVPNTPEEKELEGILEGFDQFGTPPTVELRSSGTQREVILNQDRVRASVEVDPRVRAPGWMEALGAIGAFHPSVAEKLRGLDGVPVKGTLRYVLFLERVIEQFETTAVQARDIPDSEFELPPGLVRAPLKGFENPPERKLSRPPVVPRTLTDESDGGEKKGK